MQVQLKKPELEKFIDDQVKAGYFPSPEAAVEAAVARMMVDREGESLTADDVAAVEASEAEIDRGERVEFDDFAASMRIKYGGK